MSLLPTPYEMYLIQCQSGVPSEVILGSPDYSDCRELGICRVFLEGQLRSVTNCGCEASAYLRMEPQTGRLMIHFLTATISQEAKAKHFGDGFFRVNTAYVISEALRKELHLPSGSYEIGRGKYPVLDDDHFQTISVVLYQSKAVATPAGEQQLLMAA